MKIAVVTGASSGLGKAFALKLDKLSFDEIWGVALDKEGLEETASLMKTPLKIFAVDLTADGVDVIKAALEEQKPDVKWLVNASGFGKFGRYDEIPVEHSANMIRLNCESLVRMTEYCLPYMKAGAKIAEFSSVAAFQPTPYQNVYAATKAFVHSYARALNVELKPRKITVCAVCPFWTRSKFFDRAECTDSKVVINYAAMYEPQEVVDKAFKDIIKGKDISICGFIARSQVRMVKIVPTKAVMKTWVKQQKFNKRYK
ncbi:MAG: SDR family NAD(P)-dependent oxidoreductase [Clostridia bacterium]|nr:SDR family NAD(P)-dependent oxidoreductase [Clostridia bacterium]